MVILLFSASFVAEKMKLHVPPVIKVTESLMLFIQYQ